MRIIGKKASSVKTVFLSLAFILALVMILVLVVTSAIAQDVQPSTGSKEANGFFNETEALQGVRKILATSATVSAGCMEDLAGISLNCTAEDVDVAEATNITIIEPCTYPGDTVTFSADFAVDGCLGAS